MKPSSPFPRCQLFEFIDQPWLKGDWRSAYHDCLGFVHALYQPQYHGADLVSQWASRLQLQEVLDLASGGGEQIAILKQTSYQRKIKLPKFIVSDLYPLPEFWEPLKQKLGPEALDYLTDPVSVRNPHVPMFKHWSIFTAFHHFSPEQIDQLFQSLVDGRCESLLIYEQTRRQWPDLIAMILGFFANIFAPFFSKNFTWKKFLITTIIPITPFMVAFDGVISVLRSYTRQEIEDMIPVVPGLHFDVHYQEMRWRFAPLKITLVVITRSQGGVFG